MATEAPVWYVQKYIDQAILVFQQKGFMLRGMCTEPSRIQATTVNWMIGGKGEAVPLQRGSFGPAMNAARTTVAATMADWQAADWVYETDIEKMTANEMSVVSETCGKAIGRRSDLIIMNSLNAASLTVVDAGNGNPFTLAQALQMQVTLNNQDVGFEGEDIYCGLPPLAWQQFLSYRQVNDADWVGYDGLPYKTGAKMKDWNGCKWFRSPLSYAPVPSAYSGTSLDFFMWAKRAIGYGTNYDLKSTVTWENLFSGWYHNNRFAATAQVLLPPGIVRGRFGASSAITIN
jgi:hypothetical protein